MRKIIIGIVVIVGMAVAGLFVLKSAQAPDPARFLPSLGETTVELHLEHTTQVAEALASLARRIEGEGKGASLKKAASALGPSAWLVNLAEGGTRYDLWYAAEIVDSERAFEVASALTEALGQGALDIAPLEGDFPQGMSPLFCLQNERSNLYVALYRTKKQTVMLGAPSVQELANMVVEKERSVERETHGPDWIRATFSASCLKNVGIGTLSHDQPMKVEWGLQADDTKVTLSSWSNGASVFLSREESRSLADMPPVSLYGAGSLVGLFAWTGIVSRNYPSREELLAAASEKDRFVLETLSQLMQSVGMSWGDLVHIFTQRTSVVLGSEARGLLGDFPGGYILWEGVSSDLGRRLTDVAQSLSLPFGVDSLHVDGWDGGLFLRLPLTTVMAYGPSGLLMGIVDPNGLNRSPQVPSSLEKAAMQKGPIALAIDLQELSHSLDVYEKMAALAGLPVGDLGLTRLREELSRWDRLVLRYDDLDRSTLTLYRQR